MSVSLRVVSAFSCDDHKGWDCLLGEHTEGDIIWRRNRNNDLAHPFDQPGYHWHNYEDDACNEAPLDTLEAAQADYEKYLTEKTT